MTKDPVTIRPRAGTAPEVVPPSSGSDRPVLELADYNVIADMAGTTYGTVRSWRYRKQDGFPQPWATFSGRPLWLREDIEAWLAARPVRKTRA